MAEASSAGLAIAAALLFLSPAHAEQAASGQESPPPEPSGFWTGPLRSAVPATIAGGTRIDATELVSLLKQDSAVVLDTSEAPRRPPQLAPGSLWLPPPHPGIPGSIWLPGMGLAEMPGQLEARYRERLVDLTKGDKGRAVVVYCHASCWLSWNAAKRIIGYGYRKVYWFAAGVEGWTAAAQTTVPLEPPPEH